jgi:hypothetical protein
VTPQSRCLWLWSCCPVARIVSAAAHRHVAAAAATPYPRRAALRSGRQRHVANAGPFLPGVVEPQVGATFIQTLLDTMEDPALLSAWLSNNCATRNVTGTGLKEFYAPFALGRSAQEAAAQPQLAVCRDNRGLAEKALACAPWCLSCFLQSVPGRNFLLRAGQHHCHQHYTACYHERVPGPPLMQSCRQLCCASSQSRPCVQIFLWCL